MKKNNDRTVALDCWKLLGDYNAVNSFDKTHSVNVSHTSMAYTQNSHKNNYIHHTCAMVKLLNRGAGSLNLEEKNYNPKMKLRHSASTNTNDNEFVNIATSFY